MSMRFAVLCLACLAAPVGAATYQVDYSATVQATSGSAMPPPGAAVTGRVVMDDDPLAYTPADGAPQAPNYFAYQLLGPPYASSITLPGAAYSTPLFALEVFDNDLSLLGINEPGDAISLSAKRDGFSFILLLRGPASSFSGLAVPSPALIQSFWTSATVLGRDSALQSFSANVTALTVSPVPEPAGLALFAFGLCGLAWRGRRSGALG